MRCGWGYLALAMVRSAVAPHPNAHTKFGVGWQSRKRIYDDNSYIKKSEAICSAFSSHAQKSAVVSG